MTDCKYILVGGKPVPEPDLMKWAAWFGGRDNRRVAWTELAPEVAVSTVFLGLDHNFSGTGGPVLWETMVFARAHDAIHNDMERYTSDADARAGHERMVAKVRAYLAGLLN